LTRDFFGKGEAVLLPWAFKREAEAFGETALSEDGEAEAFRAAATRRLGLGEGLGLRLLAVGEDAPRALSAVGLRRAPMFGEDDIENPPERRLKANTRARVARLPEEKPRQRCTAAT
jgi:hypothetical protein